LKNRARYRNADVTSFSPNIFVASLQTAGEFTFWPYWACACNGGLGAQVGLVLLARILSLRSKTAGEFIFWLHWPCACNGGLGAQVGLSFINKLRIDKWQTALASFIQPGG
jgi:hypothetical protein